jgi:DNA repair exonuclease SbcCD nuclease subunit
MRVVVTSDWHLDHVTHGVSRFAELETAVHRTVDAAIEEGADAYFFLGDLCDPDSGSCVFRCAKVALDAATRLAAKGIASIWLAGNHDVIEDGTGCTTLTPLLAMAAASESVHVAERPCLVELGDGYRVICLPFTATSHAYDVEASLLELARGCHDRDKTIVLSHLNVPGVIPGEETTEMPRGREVVLPVAWAKTHAGLVLQGHYHRKQKTNDGVWIPGSLARLTFGEEKHDPGFLVVEV